MRPEEMLAGQDGTGFKRFIPAGPGRAQMSRTLYGPHAAVLRGGFLSHVAGKLFVRTGQRDVRLRIHNVTIGDALNPGAVELAPLVLLHAHAADWEDWSAKVRYRLDHGSYRASLPAARPLHDHLRRVVEAEGADGLRAFYDRVCADTPEHRAALSRLGLLRVADLGLEDKIARTFPL